MESEMSASAILKTVLKSVISKPISYFLLSAFRFEPILPPPSVF
jgi:hypothetical protein